MPKNLMTICDELESIRNLVNQEFGVRSTEQSNFWLPIVCTARGAIFAEVITQLVTEKYHQPYHLKDRLRQPLYRLGFQLLDRLQASPAVYLLQFDFNDTELLFDRLIPFPDRPAIASVGVQEPDLFECHLLCTTNQPIYDLIIKSDRQLDSSHITL